MMPELHRWQIISNGRAHFACGYLYNDPHVADGTYIRTAKLRVVRSDSVDTATKTYRLIGPQV